jgi:hypothetical protein
MGGASVPIISVTLECCWKANIQVHQTHIIAVSTIVPVISSSSLIGSLSCPRFCMKNLKKSSRGDAEGAEKFKNKDLWFNLRLQAWFSPRSPRLRVSCFYYSIASNRQLSTHSPQRVHNSALLSTAFLRYPMTSRVIRRGGQAATQRPQPLQRETSISGTFERSLFRAPAPSASM